MHDSDKNYDVIFSDVFSSLASIPTHFATTEFFEVAKSRMSENGVFIANIIGALSQDKPNYMLSQIKTFRQVFPNSYFFAVQSNESEKRQNFLFVGVNGKLDLDIGAVIKSEDEILGKIGENLILPEDLDFDGQFVFTDDYAPVETLTAKQLLLED